jgi:ubiquinone/menaquinone biosynthesis C-methylase UbiE
VDTVERFYDKLVIDRPMVLANAERLPFKDDTFDFVIASHVLEHSEDPVRFISEMERVGMAGYIEVPDAFMERLTNYPFHRLEITDVNNELQIRKKQGETQDPELFESFKNKARGIARHWFERNPFNFHVRYYWSRESGGVHYNIVNAEYQFNWQFSQPSTAPTPEKMSAKTMFNKAALYLFRKFLSQNRRNREIKLEKYLLCLNCEGQVLRTDVGYTCAGCNQLYPFVPKQIPDFT